MKVILLRDVAKVGRKFQVKEVSDGYGRNLLITRGLALPATAANLAKTGELIKGVAASAASKKELVEKGVEELAGLEIFFERKASPAGHLFAAIHPAEILAEIINVKKLELEMEWLEAAPLKTVGQHTVYIKLGKARVPITVTVTTL